MIVFKLSITLSNLLIHKGRADFSTLIREMPHIHVNMYSGLLCGY